jgi:hypothetical protein
VNYINKLVFASALTSHHLLYDKEPEPKEMVIKPVTAWDIPLICSAYPTFRRSQKEYQRTAGDPLLDSADAKIAAARIRDEKDRIRKAQERRERKAKP